MTLTPRTGIWLFPDTSAKTLVDATVAADRAGVDEMWIADEGVMREPMVVLSAAALQTDRIKLAIGITTPVLRHPGALGSSIATLDELSDGRAMLGLGVGGGLTLDPFGLRAEKPVRLIRDAIRIARAVIERRSAEGYDVPDHAMPPRRVPLFVGSRGEQINRLASQCADGAFLSGVAFDDLDRQIALVRSARPIHVALYVSVRFAPGAQSDANSLAGEPAAIADRLAALVSLHRPETIGLALVDQEASATMMTQALETISLFWSI